MNICGTIIDHKLLSSDEIQQRYEKSVSTWNEFCDEPYDFLNTKKPTDSYVQKSTYDIGEAITRQRNFNYQIGLPHYTALKFLGDAIDRYVIVVLLLKYQQKKEFKTSSRLKL